MSIRSLIAAAGRALRGFFQSDDYQLSEKAVARIRLMDDYLPEPTGEVEVEIVPEPEAPVVSDALTSDYTSGVSR